MNWDDEESNDKHFRDRMLDELRRLDDELAEHVNKGMREFNKHQNSKSDNPNPKFMLGFTPLVRSVLGKYACQMTIKDQTAVLVVPFNNSRSRDGFISDMLEAFDNDQ